MSAFLKSVFGVLLLSTVISSCTKEPFTPNKNAELIIKDSTQGHSLKIYAYQPQEDSTVNGFYSTRDPRRYVGYRFSFSGVMAAHLKTTEKFITLNNLHGLDSLFFDIEVEKDFFLDMDYDSLIGQQIVDYYRLEIEENKRVVPMHYLYIQDSLQLEKFYSPEMVGSSYEDETFKFKGMPLFYIAQFLNIRCTDNFEFEGLNNRYYNIDFPIICDPEKASVYFEKYGLAIKSIPTEKGYYTIFKQ